MTIIVDILINLFRLAVMAAIAIGATTTLAVQTGHRAGDYASLRRFWICFMVGVVAGIHNLQSKASGSPVPAAPPETADNPFLADAVLVLTDAGFVGLFAYSAAMLIAILTIGFIDP